VIEGDRRAPDGGRATPAGHIELGPGAEFDLIRAVMSQLAGGASGIGGDCAVIAMPPDAKLVLSTDTSVENVHFRRSWITPAEIGYRATAAALSDLAAAGAAPIAILVAVSAPAAWLSDLPAVAGGAGAAARDAGTVVVGGDTTSGPVLTLTVTVAGASERPLYRSGARPGDRVYVTGRLGGPAAAVRAWTHGAEPDTAARARFAHPAPRLREGQWLAAHAATAAIDVSDGLVADLRHLAAASGVRLSLDLDRLPRWPGATVLEGAAGGEEYELAVTAGVPLDTVAFERTFGIPLTLVGDALPGNGTVDAYEGGVRIASIPGYDHFSASPLLGTERRDPESR
jgi:thiamine-monophosphate kinase